MKISIALALLSAIIISSCTQNEKARKKIERKKPSHPVQYVKQDGAKWSKQHKANSSEIKIVTTVNRTDFRHLALMDSILVPDVLDGDIAYYLPFPLSVSGIKKIDKIIYFSYGTQSFGAYENGELVYTGATNMGRKTDATPTGLYFTNWKAEETTSTFNDEWDLRWNVNIENKLGIGWHQYDLPGYPASHSCLRLQEADARYLYTWADQWVLKKDAVKIKGTPVIVFGNYNFDGEKPWLQLMKDANALNIRAKEIKEVTQPHLDAIMLEQENKEKKQQKN